MSQITKVLGSKNIRVETVTANREGRTSFHDLLIWRTAKLGLLLNRPWGILIVRIRNADKIYCTTINLSFKELY